MLSSAGLALDLIGVILLGIDVIKIQRDLKQDAEHRLADLSDIIDGNANIDEWLEQIGRDAIWRETHREEGREVFIPGTFDARAAHESFRESLGAVSNLARDVKTLGQITFARFEGDVRSANRSLFTSYLGLGFILVGFGLQLGGNLLT